MKNVFEFIGTVKYYAQIHLQVWQNSVCTGAVSKWLKQAMRGSAFFRNIFGQAKTECRKNGTQGIVFIRNSIRYNKLRDKVQ